MDKLPIDPNLVQRLDLHDGRTSFHVFDKKSILAVNTAIACGRPLLVRGEPGTGKSQLAAAVAAKLGAVALKEVVDERTEPRELLWRYDAIGRLADAQAYGALLGKDEEVRKPEPRNYLYPGPLWWAFGWKSAADHLHDTKQPKRPVPEGASTDKGVVLLIDEIDKADTAVPNALLESLGSGRFLVPGYGEVCKTEPAPLIILTTNTDRALPDAFIRRCIVLHLSVPRGAELTQWLFERGKQHFEDEDDELLMAAAKHVSEGRKAAIDNGVFSPPGLAEHIDLLTALTQDRSLELEDIAKFVLSKHEDPDAPGHG